MNIDEKKLLYKGDALLELLRTHLSVFLHVDTRVPGTVVPPPLLDQPQVVLQLGSDLEIPITDLEVDKTGWSATLAFGPKSFFCIIPWESVYVIAGDTGVGAAWPQDAPTDMPAPPQRVGSVADAAAGRVECQAERPGSARQQINAILQGGDEKKSKLPAGWKVLQGGKKDSVPEDPPQRREPGPHSD